jgi:hypothetical protein
VNYDAALGDATAIDAGSCALAANTYASGMTNPAGCNVLLRDATACAEQRSALGLSGFWLRFSCSVNLGISGQNVTVSSDGLPDYRSNYFTNAHACHENYTAAGVIQNPNLIAVQSLAVQFPRSPNQTSSPMMGAVVGIAANGVAIFGNFAAPNDDIYQEAMTFDRCGAHPQGQGMYHYHSEPYAISYDDGNFVGVLRDGHPVYGRRDPDNTYPADLDGYGGHSGATIDSATPVYHYHVNQQTNPKNAGQKQWFITKGSYRGSANAPCTGC